MPAFSDELKALRGEAGFPSAWAFYKALGPGFLGCTFKAYLYLEKGRSVPQAKLAQRVLAGLKASDDPPRARRFWQAYLRSLLSRRELAEFMLRTLSRPRDSHGLTDILQRASRQMYAGKSLAITQPQADALLSSWETYWCWIAVSDDVEHWTPTRLAEALGAAPGRVRASLERIVGLGLFAKDAQGLYYCPHAGKAFNFPRDSFYLPRYRQLVAKRWSEMAARRGKVLFDRFYLMRASEADVRGYFPHLAQMANGARVYAVDRKGPDTAFIAVTARVQKLFPF